MVIMQSSGAILSKIYKNRCREVLVETMRVPSEKKEDFSQALLKIDLLANE